MRKASGQDLTLTKLTHRSFHAIAGSELRSIEFSHPQKLIYNSRRKKEFAPASSRPTPSNFRFHTLCPRRLFHEKTYRIKPTQIESLGAFSSIRLSSNASGIHIFRRVYRDKKQCSWCISGDLQFWPTLHLKPD